MLLGFSGGRAEEFEPSRLFKSIDTNADGVVDRVEYMYGARDSLDDSSVEDKTRREAVYIYVGDLYDLSDVDGDGVLTEREFLFGQYLSGEEKYAAERKGDEKEKRGVDLGARAAQVMHKRLDTNKDDLVDPSEFGVLWAGGFPNMASGGQKHLSDVAARFAGEADFDGDGGLSWREFQFACFLVSSHAAQEAAATLIRGLDRDGDGRVAREEVTETIALMREAGAPGLQAARQVRNGFATADVDGDGYIDRWEAMQIAKGLLGGEL